MIASFASDIGPWLGGVAVLITILTFIATQIQQSRSLVKAASTEWVATLEKELALFKEKFKECEDDREKLHGRLDKLEEEVEKCRQREYKLLRRLDAE